MAGVLLGLWQFGIGRYRGLISNFTVILISAFVAGVGYLFLALVSQNLIVDMEDLPEGIIGGILNVAGYFGMNFQWLDNGITGVGSYIALGVVIPLVIVGCCILYLTRRGFHLSLGAKTTSSNAAKGQPPPQSG